MVGYGGASETITAVMGGHIMLGMPQPVAVKDLVASGQLNAPVTFSKKPSSSLPNVPTFHSRYPGNYYSMLQGVFAPPGTPAEIQKVLEEALKKAVADPEFRAKYKDTIAIEEMDSKEYATAVSNLYTLANKAKASISEFGTKK